MRGGCELGGGFRGGGERAGGRWEELQRVSKGLGGGERHALSSWFLERSSERTESRTARGSSCGAISNEMYHASTSSARSNVFQCVTYSLVRPSSEREIRGREEGRMSDSSEVRRVEVARSCGGSRKVEGGFCSDHELLRRFKIGQRTHPQDPLAHFRDPAIRLAPLSLPAPPLPQPHECLCILLAQRPPRLPPHLLSSQPLDQVSRQPIENRHERSQRTELSRESERYALERRRKGLKGVGRESPSRAEEG